MSGHTCPYLERSPSTRSAKLACQIYPASHNPTTQSPTLCWGLSFIFLAPCISSILRWIFRDEPLTIVANWGGGVGQGQKKERVKNNLWPFIYIISAKFPYGRFPSAYLTALQWLVQCVWQAVHCILHMDIYFLQIIHLERQCMATHMGQQAYH